MSRLRPPEDSNSSVPRLPTVPHAISRPRSSSRTRCNHGAAIRKVGASASPSPSLAGPRCATFCYVFPAPDARATSRARAIACVSRRTSVPVLGSRRQTTVNTDASDLYGCSGTARCRPESPRTGSCRVRLASGGPARTRGSMRRDVQTDSRSGIDALALPSRFGTARWPDEFRVSPCQARRGNFGRRRRRRLEARIARSRDSTKIRHSPRTRLPRQSWVAGDTPRNRQVRTFLEWLVVGECRDELSSALSEHVRARELSSQDADEVDSDIDEQEASPQLRDCWRDEAVLALSAPGPT
ncbi:hypothetical protein C8T65DRAFT_833887 [Cerioporus squamosus]|nr:hypothetical protein C8T65DRAFT_833887 [Cerioporus squamosus]